MPPIRNSKARIRELRRIPAHHSALEHQTSQGFALISSNAWQWRSFGEAFMAVCSWYLTTQECAMNAFYEHHKGSIQFGYRCFDRILLNGLIQPFQQPERVLGFFNTY